MRPEEMRLHAEDLRAEDLHVDDFHADDFKPVSLEDREILAGHYERFPQVHSDNTFTNMVCWNHYAHYRYACVDGCIILSSTINEKTRYRPPIGPRSPDLLADVMRLAADSGDESGDEFPLMILDPESVSWIREIYPELNLIPRRDYFDYVYRSSDLAELPGKKYSTIRRQLNQFQRECSPVVETIADGNIAEVREFLEQWCDWRDCEGDPMLLSEKEAVIFAIEHFKELKLSGLAIRAEGKIGAISIFEGMNRETALVHFEKGLPDCKGIYRAINAETARLLSKDYAYINRESDMGIEGLREAKMRYQPHHMVEVHVVKREEIERVV